jgi:FkbM family methyltransferase
MMTTIDFHSLDLEKLTRGGWIIDAGCRGFEFTRGWLDLGFKVFALDADPTMTVPDDLLARPDFRFCCAAVVGNQTNEVRFAMDDGTVARHVVTPEMSAYRWPVITVKAMTISQVLEQLGVESVEAVKLDVEGSEYEILKKWPGPVAKQINVSYHEHTCSNPRGWVTYEEIQANLAKWYDQFGFEKARLEPQEVGHYTNVTWILR